MHTFAEKLPEKGQRIVVSGAHVSGGVPTSDGTFATFIDTERGYVVLEGNTSDRTFLDLDGPAVWRPRDEDEPVGLAEIAEQLGVARATVDQWRARDLLPEPRWTVGGRPAWSLDDILRWARETGRLT